MNRDHEQGISMGYHVRGDEPAKAVDNTPSKENIGRREERIPGRCERRPGTGSGWSRSRPQEKNFRAIADWKMLIAVSVWRRNGIVAISTLVTAAAPDGTGDVIPQWHVSFGYWEERGSSGPVRITDEEARRCCASFGIAGADEDNHEPGSKRHFWMPVDPRRRVDCECKTSEKVITEPDGHRWSTPRDDRECYGCKHEVEMGAVGLKRPCPVHAASGEVVAQQARINAGHAAPVALDVSVVFTSDEVLADVRKRQEETAAFVRDLVEFKSQPADVLMIVGGESPHVLREAIAARAANPDATMMIGIQRRTHNGDAEAAFLERELANICLRPKAITNSGICVLGVGHPGDCEYE